MLNPRHENLLYHMVLSGEWQIDQDGQIWRVKIRVGNRWTGATIVASCARRRVERPTTEGYLQVRVLEHGKRVTALAHRLVYRHVHGEIPVGLTVNHKNGVKNDNRPSNLELATYSEQAIHAMAVLGRNQRLMNQNGAQNHAAKLTADQVAMIRSRRASGEELKSIAKAFDVSDRTISKIARGERWVEADHE